MRREQRRRILQLPRLRSGDMLDVPWSCAACSPCGRYMPNFSGPLLSAIIKTSWAHL